MSAGADLGGRTRIEPKALRGVAVAVASATAGVDPGDVRAVLSSARGELAVSIVTPIRQPRTGTLLDGAAEVMAVVATRVPALTGRAVGRVDVRLTGVQRTEERRVR